MREDTPIAHPEAPAAQIQPCTSFNNTTSNAEYISRFHLLICGHIVVISDPNRRCGRNCLHVQSQNDEFVASQISREMSLSLGRPSVSLDLLYCEVCEGITFERRFPTGLFLQWTGASADFIHRYRQCHALTKRELQITLAISADEASSMLSTVFPGQMLHHGEQAHALQCGHTVYSTPCICTANCTNCNPTYQDWANTRSIAALICAECVIRAEVMLRRNNEPLRS
jgi:hypothetical protein